MTNTPDEPLSDEDMTTSGEGGDPASDPIQGGSDADGTDGSDSDGTDGDSTDSSDGDSTDADGTDGTDADGTDGTDGTAL